MSEIATPSSPPAKAEVETEKAPVKAKVLTVFTEHVDTAEAPAATTAPDKDLQQGENKGENKTEKASVSGDARGTPGSGNNNNNNRNFNDNRGGYRGNNSGHNGGNNNNSKGNNNGGKFQHPKNTNYVPMRPCRYFVLGTCQDGATCSWR